MSDDEDQRRDERQRPSSVGSGDTSSAPGKRRRDRREAAPDSAVDIVDRLEQALRDLFK